MEDTTMENSIWEKFKESGGGTDQMELSTMGRGSEGRSTDMESWLRVTGKSTKESGFWTWDMGGGSFRQEIALYMKESS